MIRYDKHANLYAPRVKVTIELQRGLADFRLKLDHSRREGLFDCITRGWQVFSGGARSASITRPAMMAQAASRGTG